MFSPVAMGGLASREAVTPILPSSPTIPLSIQTLKSSDFISRLAPQIIYPEDHVEEKFQTPSPITLPLPSTLTVGQDESLRALQRHMFSRLPAVREASKALQNMLGICNSNHYDAPSQPEIFGAGRLVGANPALKHLMHDFGGSLIKGPGEVGIGDSVLLNLIDDLGGPPTKNFGYPNQTGMDTLADEKEKDILAPNISMEMNGGGGIEKGKLGLEPRRAGLRETLLWHGRQPYGKPQRIEMATLTFHDVTPSMNSTFTHELLGHFVVDCAGTTRIVSYEVNVIPAGPYNDVNPPIPERWISFMITTPILNITKDYYLDRGVDCFPPNLPSPIPTSWVIFAAPLSCVKVFKPLRDQIITNFPTKNPIKTKPKVWDVIRHDFNFSLDGTPVFEFMDKRSALGDLGVALGKGIHGQFLCSMKDLPGWTEMDSNDDNWGDIADLPVRYTPTSTPIFRRTKIAMDVEDFLAYEAFRFREQPSARPDVEIWGQEVDMDGEAGVGVGEKGEQGERDMDEPFNMENSLWWTHARVNFWKDSRRWERIMDCMSRGCCCVIATEANALGPIPGSKYEAGFPSGHPLRAKNNFGREYDSLKWRGVKRKSAIIGEDDRSRRKSFDILGPPIFGEEDFPTPAMTATMSLMDEVEETHHRDRKRLRHSRKD